MKQQEPNLYCLCGSRSFDSRRLNSDSTIEDADRETALFVNGYSLKKGLSRQKEVLFVLFANGYYSIP